MKLINAFLKDTVVNISMFYHKYCFEFFCLFDMVLNVLGNLASIKLSNEECSFPFICMIQGLNIGGYGYESDFELADTIQARQYRYHPNSYKRVAKLQKIKKKKKRKRRREKKQQQLDEIFWCKQKKKMKARISKPKKKKGTRAHFRLQI